MSELLEAALRLAQAGIRVLPLHGIEDGRCTCGGEDTCDSPGKHPRTKHGVKDASSDPEQVRSWWKRWPRANVAIATGKGSGVDVLDVDGPAGEKSLRSLGRSLPLTPQASTGKGRHVYFRHDERLKNRVSIAPGIDVRTEGGYVVAAPSEHVSGKIYGWDLGLDEVEVAPWPVWLTELQAQTKVSPPPTNGSHAHAGNLSKLSPYTAKVVTSALEEMGAARAPSGGEAGTRSHTLTRTAFILGQLTGAGEDIGDALSRLKEIAIGKGLDPGKVEDTAQRQFSAGIQHPKTIRIKKIPPQAKVTRPPLKRPPASIEVVAWELERMALESEDALITGSFQVYSRFGELVRAREGSGGRLLVDGIPEPQLLKYLCRSAVWWKWSLSKKDPAKEECKPPLDVVRVLATQGTWKFNELLAVYDCPTLRPDGTVLQDPGYDKATKAIYQPKCAFPRIPENPTRDEALAALEVLWEPFGDFPFADSCDRAACLAMVLTILGRPWIEGATPLFAVRATDRGSGKSLLVDIAALITTGVTAPRMTHGEDQDEEAKRLLSLGLESAPFAMIDNVSKPLGGDLLAAAVTSRVFKGRLLGVSKMVEIQVPVLVATGVNMSVKDDLGRRVLPIDLDPRMERPAQRSGFKHDPIEEWVLAHRPELVAAGLTVIRAFEVAGRPQTVGVLPFGSFAPWSQRIRHGLLWLGEDDPVAGQVRIMEDDDIEHDSVRSLLLAWHAQFGAAPMTAQDAVRVSERDESLRIALTAFNSGKSLLEPRKIGYALRKIRGRVVDGLRLESADRVAAGMRWTVVSINSQK